MPTKDGSLAARFIDTARVFSRIYQSEVLHLGADGVVGVPFRALSLKLLLGPDSAAHDGTSTALKSCGRK
jgi:hypothetical protein